MEKLGLKFDDVDVKSIKETGDIESYCQGKTETEVLNIARYVTDCKNAVANIKAKEKEVETLTAVVDQMKTLKGAGEASEVDVIDSELSLLKSNIELEVYYFDMNVTYYSIVGE